MGFRGVTKLKVGYWPLSSNLSSPGDRRRVIFWAEARGHEIVLDCNQKVDVIIASEKTDFNSPLFSATKAPVIFDLIDAYLSPHSLLEDTSRGLAKKLTGQISGKVKPFSMHVRDFCLNAKAVICSSPEQESLIRVFNLNTHVILDSHEEFPMNEFSFRARAETSNFRLLWEGQPATIRGVKQISSVLSELDLTHPVNIDFVTDKQYFQFLGKYIKRETGHLLERDLKDLYSKASLTPWTRKNLSESAFQSDAAIIPIDLSIPMQRLKPENRLLIMWRLGLPCLTSATPAYVRVATQAGVNSTCELSSDWLENFKRLLNDRYFAREEVLRGQNYIHENHNRDSILRKWDLVIESVLS